MATGKDRTRAAAWILAGFFLWPLLGGTGAVLGLLVGKYLGDGKDNIFHPLLWTTPLGGGIGLGVAAVVVTIMAFRGR